MAKDGLGNSLGECKTPCRIPQVEFTKIKKNNTTRFKCNGACGRKKMIMPVNWHPPKGLKK